MSPDGRRLAHTEREGEKFFLVLRDLEAKTLKRIPVAEDRAEELSGAREKTPARITFLRWTDGNRLVFNLNSGSVWSIRPDGSDSRRLADVRTFAAELPPTEWYVVGVSDIGGTVSEVALAPDSGIATRAMNQAVSVTALPRGDRFVFVEAEMKERGRFRDFVPVFRNMREISVPNERGTPRVVLRVDAATGKQEEWAETPGDAESCSPINKVIRA